MTTNSAMNTAAELPEPYYRAGESIAPTFQPLFSAEQMQTMYESGLRARQAPAPVEVSRLGVLAHNVSEMCKGALRIPNMPFPDAGAHGLDAYCRAVHRSYCDLRFKLIDIMREAEAHLTPQPITASMASTPVGEVPAGFWLAPMEPDEGMRASLNTGPGRWVYTNVETYQRMRDSWLARHPTSPALAASKGAEADDDQEERENAAWRDQQIEHERDLDHLHEVISQHSNDAMHWFRACNAARDCLRHLLEECKDSDECSNGFLSTGRVQEIIARDVGELPSRSDDDPQNYVDGPRVAAPSEPEAQKAVAWLRPDTGEVCHADRKSLWIESEGGYRSIAERYTIPLYASPSPAASMEVQGLTTADRLDAMADASSAGSQQQSDLYAAATVWRKHSMGGQ